VHVRAGEALVHAARVALSRRSGGGGGGASSVSSSSSCVGVAYLTASRLCFLEDASPAEAPARAPLAMVLPLTHCAAVEAEEAAPLGGVRLRLRREGGGEGGDEGAAAADTQGEAVWMSVLPPPADAQAPPPRKPVSLHAAVAGYWAKAAGVGESAAAAGAA
jgi:hypothetical protein